MNGIGPGDNLATQRDLRSLCSECANDRAHDHQHGEPMTGIDDCHNRLRTVKGLVGSSRAQHEPDPDKEGADDPAPDGDVRQMTHQTCQHPGHEKATNRGDDEGERRWFTVFTTLAKRLLPNLAEGRIPSPADEKSGNGSDDDREVVDRNGSHVCSPYALRACSLSPTMRLMMLHSSPDTRCTDSRELLTRTIPLSALVALISASVTGFGTSLTAATSTHSQTPLPSVESGCASATILTTPTMRFSSPE